MARYKGSLQRAVQGAAALGRLRTATGCSSPKLHPPPAVRRYRDSQTAELDPAVYGEGAAVCLYLRQGVSGGFVPLCAGGALRRLYAERARDAVARTPCRRMRRADDQLRDCDCADARNPGAFARAIPGGLRRAGLTKSSPGFGQGSFHNCKYGLQFCVYHSVEPNRAENR